MFPDTILGIATGFILLGIGKIIWSTRGYTKDIADLKNNSHSPPCSEITAIKISIEGIEKDISWLVKENGGRIEK